MSLDTVDEAQWGSLIESLSSCAVFTSTLPRAMQTAALVDCNSRPQATSALNPIDRGSAYWLTDEQFMAEMPEVASRWREDMRNTRFPGGESYADLYARVEPFLIELEQQTAPTLVVSHLSVLQVLTSYFTGTPLQEVMLRCCFLPTARVCTHYLSHAGCILPDTMWTTRCVTLLLSSCVCACVRVSGVANVHPGAFGRADHARCAGDDVGRGGDPAWQQWPGGRLRATKESIQDAWSAHSSTSVTANSAKRH